MKKIYAAMIISLVFGLSACQAQEPVPESSSAKEELTAEAKDQEETKVQGETKDQKETRTVTDTWGRTVEIPATVESIICLGSGAPRMAAYLGVVDMMVGAEEHDIQNQTVLRDYNPVWQERLKALPAVGAGGGSGNNNGYPEEIVGLNPDVIVAAFSQEAADELFTQTGIPVVCVRYISNDLANDTFYSALRVFAEVVGRQDRCETLLAYIDDSKADLKARTAALLDDQKPRVYNGAITFNGRHGFAGTSAKFGPFTATNTINVADEAKVDGYYEVDLEKVIIWDPDVIFLDPGNMDLVNDEYRTNPGYFDSLRAVQEEQVYTMPSFNNCGMNITYALMDAYYTGIVLYPDQFSDVTIEAKAQEILTLFLGEDTFREMAEGGLYYGKIQIGDGAE